MVIHCKTSNNLKKCCLCTQERLHAYDIFLGIWHHAHSGHMHFFFQSGSAFFIQSVVRSGIGLCRNPNTPFWNHSNKRMKLKNYSMNTNLRNFVRHWSLFSGIGIVFFGHSVHWSFSSGHCVIGFSGIFFFGHWGIAMHVILAIKNTKNTSLSLKRLSAATHW